MMRTATVVGPAVVLGSGGGVISTSMISWAPAATVRCVVASRTQLAVGPAGTMVKSSTASPELWIVSGAVRLSPGSTAT